MQKRLIAVLLVIILASPLLYAGFAYHSYGSVISKSNPKAADNYVVLYSSAKFYVLTESEYEKFLEEGYRPPENSKVFNVTVESFLTGSPGVDLNLTLRSVYDRFTIVVGDPSVANCKDSPQLYMGNCKYRTLAVSEISGVVSNIFSTNYYLMALQMGYDNETAKEYAFNQTWMRHRSAYLSLWTKMDIGRGKIGNQDHLAVILLGPAEGARRNRIFAPRKGLLVIEGTSDETLRAEIVLIERLIGFKWPEGNSTTTG